MNEEIYSKVQQKKYAADNIAHKIETIEYSIEAKQRALMKLVAELERKRSDIARMEELAEEHAGLEQRLNTVTARMREILATHHWEPGMDEILKIDNNPEMQVLKAEHSELVPKVKEYLPKIMSIFYGKG
jgi:multidrug resistance efflux pump